MRVVVGFGVQACGEVAVAAVRSVVVARCRSAGAVLVVRASACPMAVVYR